MWWRNCFDEASSQSVLRPRPGHAVGGQSDLHYRCIQNPYFNPPILMEDAIDLDKSERTESESRRNTCYQKLERGEEAKRHMRETVRMAANPSYT